jgi:hypothetical protein
VFLLEDDGKGLEGQVENAENQRIPVGVSAVLRWYSEGAPFVQHTIDLTETPCDCGT